MPRRLKDSPSRDPQQVIEDQAQRIERLEEDLKRSEIERNRLRRENERLKQELDGTPSRESSGRVVSQCQEDLVRGAETSRACEAAID